MVETVRPPRLSSAEGPTLLAQLSPEKRNEYNKRAVELLQNTGETVDQTGEITRSDWKLINEQVVRPADRAAENQKINNTSITETVKTGKSGAEKLAKEAQKNWHGQDRRAIDSRIKTLATQANLSKEEAEKIKDEVWRILGEVKEGVKSPFDATDHHFDKVRQTISRLVRQKAKFGSMLHRSEGAAPRLKDTMHRKWEGHLNTMSGLSEGFNRLMQEIIIARQPEKESAPEQIS